MKNERSRLRGAGTCRRGLIIALAALGVLRASGALAAVGGVTAHDGVVSPSRAARVAVGLAADMGLARSPFPSPSWQEISGMLTTFRLDGGVRLSDELALALRAPLALAGVDLPAGGVRPDTAWGHPELALVGSLLTRTVASTTAAVDARLGVAFPLGGDNAVPTLRPFANQTLTLAAAQDGWRDRELFAPGRLAVTSALSAGMAHGPLRGFAALKLPMMWAVKRDALASDPAVRVRTLGTSLVLGAGAARSFGRFEASLAPWLVWDAVPAAVLRGASPSRVALTVVPEVAMRLTDRFTVAARSTVFVAGALRAFPSFALAAAVTL